MITEPVEVREPIRESAREKIFRVTQYPPFYRVEAICPDGTTKIIENVRCYTESVRVDDVTGRIEITLGSERKEPEYHVKVGHPYYYLHASRVLCALKKWEMKIQSDDVLLTFGLNYNLFEIPWELCVVLHEFNGSLMALATSRAEWDRGELKVENREVQMFFRVPQERHVPVSLMKLMVAPEIVEWMEFCEQTMKRKSS